MSSEEHLPIWLEAKSGNPDSLAALLRLYQDQIFRFCCSRLGDRTLAKDATQETALRLIAQLDKFRGHGKLATWILGIANNVCREQRRQSQRWKQLEPTDSTPDQETSGSAVYETVNREEVEQLRDAIANLSERQQEAIVLRYFESLSVDETAEVMKVSSGTVKATISQALKNLRIKFKAEDES